MNCDVALEALQSRLDGNAHPADPAIARHLRQCDDCRSRFAAADLLLAVYAPRVTPDLTVRMRNAVHRDLRFRTYRDYAVSAACLAATVMLAIWLSFATKTEADRTVVIAKVPSMERRVSNAKSAIMGWGGQTISLFGMPKLTERRITTDDLEQTIEPATNALSNAGKGLVDGMEPLTTSAKRAAYRFWNDLPTTPNPQTPEKP